MDYSLKFNDEAQAINILYDGEQPRYQNIDIIGTIYRNTGTPEEPIMIAIEGFHVNVRTNSPEIEMELEPFVVYPVTPSRVWA